MNIETVLHLVLLLQMLLFAPACWFAVFLWRLDRRVFRCELELGIEEVVKS